MTGRRRHRFETAAALAVFSAVSAAAASDAPDADASLQNAERFDLSLFAPSAPAFVVLGLSPRRAADPGSFHTYGFDAANLSNADGFEAGGAYSLEPFWIGHSDLTLRQYRDDTSVIERVFARTQTSLAASYSSGNGARFYSTGLAAQAQLLDRQDERFDPESYACLFREWQNIRKPVEQTADDAVFDYLTTHPDATEDDLKAVRDRVLKEQGAPSQAAFGRAQAACRDLAALRALARPSLMAGLGTSLRISDSHAAASGYDGLSLWATYRQPILEDGLISLEAFGRHTFATHLDTMRRIASRDAKGDDTTLGGGLAAEAAWWRIEGAGSWSSQSFDDRAFGSRQYFTASLTGAVRFHEGLWLQASASNDFGGPDRGKPYFGLAVKYDWSELTGAP